MSFLEDLAPDDLGTLCACALQGCSCGQTADFRWRGEALCGCCLGDCPDVHPERYAELHRGLLEVAAAVEASNEMVSEGGPVGPEKVRKVPNFVRVTIRS